MVPAKLSIEYESIALELGVTEPLTKIVIAPNLVGGLVGFDRSITVGVIT